MFLLNKCSSSHTYFITGPSLLPSSSWLSVFLEPAPFDDFSQVSRTQCFNLNTDPILWFCFACVWTWSFIIPVVANLFQNSFLIFVCSRDFLLPSSFLCAGSPKSQLSHDSAPLFGRLQYTIMHKLNSLHYWTAACYVVRNSGKNLKSIKTFARSNETSQYQHRNKELRLYPIQQNWGSLRTKVHTTWTLMHLIICLFFSIVEGETHLT